MFTYKVASEMAMTHFKEFIGNLNILYIELAHIIN